MRAKRAKRTSKPSGNQSETRPHFGLKTWHRGVLVLMLALMAMAWLAWLCTRDPKINFLSQDGRAEWIVFPRAIDGSAHGVASLDTVFRREFELNDQPRVARLDLRAAKRAELRINGTPVEITVGRNWKDVLHADLAALLRTGKNSIEVKVFNDNAPPALWLALTLDQSTLRSDGTWETSCADSAWRFAVLPPPPRFPGPGSPIGGGERSFAALGTIWLMWLMFAGIAVVLCLAGPKWLSRWVPATGGDLSRRHMIILLLVIGGLWVLLFSNNAALVPFIQGFAAPEHLAYIKYVQDHHALPWPDDGFEMFQPPLYYVLSAVALSVCGVSADAHSGTLVLRLLTLIFGLSQFILVFLSLRLIFPGRLVAQLVGLVLAAFLPMQLYLSHYVTNETLGRH